MGHNYEGAHHELRRALLLYTVLDCYRRDIHALTCHLSEGSEL